MSENTISKPTSEPKVLQPVLRKVDLNLLTIFDTVMQEQSLTKAAQTLGMSQPAVSSAVSRLKVLFKDELFVRNGRGIKPTDRAFQLFGSVRRALQLVQNELPDTLFDPLDCERIYHLCVCSPLDNYLTPLIFNKVSEIAPRVSLSFKSTLSQQVINQLRRQQRLHQPHESDTQCTGPDNRQRLQVQWDQQLRQSRQATAHCAFVTDGRQQLPGGRGKQRQQDNGNQRRRNAFNHPRYPQHNQQR